MWLTHPSESVSPPENTALQALHVTRGPLQNAFFSLPVQPIIWRAQGGMEGIWEDVQASESKQRVWTYINMLVKHN